MSIWKELTKPNSFNGESISSVAPPVVDPPAVNAPVVDSPAVSAPAVNPPAKTEEAPRPMNSMAISNKKESTLGPGTVIEGIIEGDGDMRIAGQIKGEIRLKGNLTLDAGARVFGGVNAASATIGGQVEGNIQASGLVRLVETGQIVGDLKVKFLTVALGSRMRGNVEFGWDEPAVKPDNKKKTKEQHAIPTVINSPQEQDQSSEEHHLEER